MDAAETANKEKDELIAQQAARIRQLELRVAELEVTLEYPQMQVVLTSRPSIRQIQIRPSASFNRPVESSEKIGCESKTVSPAYHVYVNRPRQC